MLRFYEPVVKFEILDELTEDLIAIVTSLTIGKELSPWLLKLCRLSQRTDEALLTTAFEKFSDVVTEQVEIGEYFTCNYSSKLIAILKQVSSQVSLQAEKEQSRHIASVSTAPDSAAKLTEDRSAQTFSQ